ncbi:MAG: TRAP transporter substrate-binding protein DctP [Treponema sp.]|jgi:TRAP-type C4-dicarboxylate transport system substrate-binding protein|nr:TRAP transporter substrate-binding protein DctP [Treponema sp.]
MKRSVLIFALVVLYGFTSYEIWAQRGSRSQVLEVRLASSMPRNSDWGRALDRIAAEWARVTNNEVRLRVLHDGVEGGDAKMLSSLSADNIQAALFSSFGLSEICPAVMTLSVPFMIRNDAELELVLKDTLPVLEAQINRTNFAVVTWSRGGWVNMFSKDPVLVPDDLRRHKIATSPESEDLNMVFKTMGFHLVETDMADIGPRMANNMINAFYQTPAAVAPLGLHKTLRHMLDKPLAPFMGAIVVNRVTWNKISAERQREIMRVTQNIAAEFDLLMPRIVSNAINVMGRDGLTVNRPNPAQEAIWNEELAKAVPSLLGTTFDRDLYNRINGVLEKARSGR